MKKVLGIILIFCGFSQNIIAQEIDWSVALEQNEITIGDKIGIKFTAVAPQDAFINFAIEGNSEKNKIEILDIHIDTVFSENKTISAINQTIYISAYHPGKYQLKPSVSYFYPNDTSSYKEDGKSILLVVNTIAIDTTMDIRDIQSIRKEPVHFSEIFPFLLGVVILAGLIILGIYLWRKYKKKEPILKVFAKPEIPYYEIALREMEELKQKNLWQSDRIKQYYTELIDIFKFYVHGRYHIQAAEMTSDELMQALSSHYDVPKQFLPNIQYMLTNSDLVKFAKSTPLPDEHDRAYHIVLDYIKNTLPVVSDDKKATGTNSMENKD